MITTERLMIKEALPSEIDMIIDIESHPLNKDYLWVGTPEEHQDEIDDPCHLLLLFRDAATPTDWDPAAELLSEPRVSGPDHLLGPAG